MNSEPGTKLEVELLEQRDFLLALARGLVGEAGRAEDVVQEAFVAALERPPRSRHSLRPWLARVVRTRALNAKAGAAPACWTRAWGRAQ